MMPVMKTNILIWTFIISMILMAAVGCNQDNNNSHANKTEGTPEIEFKKTTHDFGELKEGEIVECSFYFKNTGDAPLLIKDVVPDCGCTVPEFKKEEIMPGEESRIKIIFNSAGFRNNVYKTIDVETNTKDAYTELTLAAFIITENTVAF
jgi:hypothetical protein